MVKWGIVGLGNIAHSFAQDLALVAQAEVSAVASRSLAKAKSFAGQYQFPAYYDNYSDLFEDETVDIVYIATPHNTHASLSIEAMRQGKHVLCEKPIAVNQGEASAMIACAKEHKVFFMEAFWSRFNPTFLALLEHIKAGDLGEVNYVNADFTFYRDDAEESRMLNMELAGGSLLDMGVYPIFLSYITLGMPEEIYAVSHKHSTGADLQTAAVLKFNGGLANVMSGFQSQSDMQARICGTKGSIFLDDIWHETQGYTFLDNRSGERTKKSLPTKGKGFTYEIEECIQCIKQKKKQSQLWSWQNSLDIMKITDEIRRQIRLNYPFENK